VVPDDFELFCLGFILIEDCVATINIPLHTGGAKKSPLKQKLDQSQQKMLLFQQVAVLY
jgi:hypothetical protein